MERRVRKNTFIISMLMVMMLVMLVLPVHAASLSKTTAFVKLGQSCELKLKGNKSKTAWKIQDPSLVSLKKIDKNTVRLTGKKNGSTKISVTADGKTYSCFFHICNFNTSTETLRYGQSLEIRFYGAGMLTVKWKSSDSSIASIKANSSRTAVIRAKKEGTATITATLGKIRYTKKIQVLPKYKRTGVIAVANEFNGNRAAAVSLVSSCGYQASVVEQLDSTDGYDALVIPGGADIHPARYGEGFNGASGCSDYLDTFQLKLVDLFVKAQKPVIGFCRGQQLINVYFGGTLNQHIPNHNGVVHTSRVDKDSYLGKLLGGSANVNSFHHQSVKVLGKGLKAIEWAEDGTIEAIVHTTLPVYGWQWHPEIGSYGKTSLGGRLLEYVLNTYYS